MKPNRDDQFFDASKRALDPTTSDRPLIERLPGDLREVIGEFRALVAVSDLCTLNGIDRLQRFKAWCLENRVSWERFCEEALPKCRKTIDRYLNTRETFGDGTYEVIIQLTTKAERAEAHRLFKAGNIRHESGAIVIGKKKIPNEPAHAHRIVEAIREAMARADAAEAETETERKLRKKDRDEAAEQAKTLQTALQQTQDELKKWKGAKVPDGITSDLERQLWIRFSTWWEHTKADITVFVQHCEAGDISTGAQSAFRAVLEAMRDEAADTAEAIKNDLAVQHPRFTRVK